MVNRFLFSVTKDCHELWVMCRGQNCSVDLRYDHCASWSVDKCSHVQAYTDNFQRQQERKKVRNLKSSYSFFLWL